jgi:hypothetical protein
MKTPPVTSRPAGRIEMIRRGAQTIALGLAWLVAVGCAVWAFGALHFDFPVGKVAVAWTFAAVVIAIMAFVRGTTRKLGVVFACFALVLAWWFTQKARNDRDWQPDVAQTAWAELNGDIVTLHNVRNCDYRTERDFHAALGDAHRAALAAHRDRPRDQLLGLAVDGAPDRQLPVRRRVAHLLFHRDAPGSR